jgi:hypothetical protein
MYVIQKSNDMKAKHIIILLALASCTNKNKNSIIFDSKTSQVEIGDTLKIQSDNHYQFRNGRVYETIETINEKSKVYFDKKNQEPVAILFKSPNGEVIEYNFNGFELEYKTIYFEKNGNNSTKEFIAYSNEEIDYSNSAFILLEKLNETDSNLILNVHYKGAYTLLSGYIIVGDMIFYRKDVAKSKLPRFDMTNKSIEITVPKRFCNKNSVVLSIFIERGIDKDIKYNRTIPGEGRSSFNEQYIKEFKWG